MGERNSNTSALARKIMIDVRSVRSWWNKYLNDEIVIEDSERSGRPRQTSEVGLDSFVSFKEG